MHQFNALMSFHGTDTVVPLPKCSVTLSKYLGMISNQLSKLFPYKKHCFHLINRSNSFGLVSPKWTNSLSLLCATKSCHFVILLPTYFIYLLLLYYLPIVPTYCTYLLYLPIVHTYCTYLLYIPIVPSYCTYLLYIPIAHTYCTYLLHLRIVHTYCTYLSFYYLPIVAQRHNHRDKKVFASLTYFFLSFSKWPLPISQSKT